MERSPRSTFDLKHNILLYLGYLEPLHKIEGLLHSFAKGVYLPIPISFLTFAVIVIVEHAAKELLVISAGRRVDHIDPAVIVAEEEI